MRLSAQTNFRFGIKGGGNLNFVNEHVATSPSDGLIPLNSGTVTYNSVDAPLMNNKSGFKFYGGGFMEISPKTPDNKFKLQIGLLYSGLAVNDKRASHTAFDNYSYDTATNVKYHLQQLSLPLTVEYYILPAFNIHIGPTLNYVIGGDRKSYALAVSQNSSDVGATLASSSTSYYKIDRKLHVGMTAGTAYYIYKGLFWEASYNLLFGKIKTKYVYLEQRIQSIQLGIGYKF